MPTNHVIARIEFTLSELGPWHFEIFAIFSRQIQVKTKKVLSECGAPGTAPCVKSVPGYSIAFIERLDKNLSLQLLG